MQSHMDRLYAASGHKNHRSNASVVYPSPTIEGRYGMFDNDSALFDRKFDEDVGATFAILFPVAGQNIDPDVNAAMQAAMNSWLADKWLTQFNSHDRYRGSISIPMNNPPAAIAEIEKWAGHPYFVQVWVPHRQPMPYGNRYYHGIWEAAARCHLPIAIHPSGSGQPSMSTPVGYSQYYLELHAIGEATALMTHITSFICEGVFDKWPDLKVVAVEGGFSWIGPLMWRLEKNWPNLKPTLCASKKTPMEYVYDNVRLTSQPIEEPPRKSDLVRLFEIIDAPRLLMFASDYPHWDYDDPKAVLSLLKSGAKQIAYENASQIYGLPA